MTRINGFKTQVSHLKKEVFEDLALELFRYQAVNNNVYAQYLNHLSVEPSKMVYEGIPFMPIDFFKSHEVKTGDWPSELLFKSSGTTQTGRSVHHVRDVGYYEQNAVSIFESLYTSLTDCVFFALLPSYQEQGNSSLIRMVDYFMSQSNSVSGGYYLDDFVKLERDLKSCLGQGKKVFLFGVGYSLLDFSENVIGDLDGLTIIETGGMKGRREEMTKEEFYTFMQRKMGDVSIHSEYGMTELFSQAYSLGGAKYKLPVHMRVKIREVNDPFSEVKIGKTGGINIIDLANVDSCAFIETKDLGRSNEDLTFEILGRIDNSDIRGCNLLIE
ncbi:MAG: acyl transferase [Reichenbachiella sp.]